VKAYSLLSWRDGCDRDIDIAVPPVPGMPSAGREIFRLSETRVTAHNHGMDRDLPPLMEMMRRLIGAPSVSSVTPGFDQSNRSVIDLLADWLDSLDFTVEVLPLSRQPGKSNLIATLGRGPGGLVLAGHTDTVPYDEGRWRTDPFRLTEADNRLYGLGTSDMKAFFALAIEAARHCRAETLQAPLIILATADEESSMDGAKDLVALGRPRARYALIGEPTGLRPVHMHKGIIMEAIHVYGHAGHSSNPQLGASALEGMHKVLGDLLAWRGELQAAHHDPRFAVPVPTLNPGYIQGGDNPNRICAHCELPFRSVHRQCLARGTPLVDRRHAAPAHTGRFGDRKGSRASHRPWRRGGRLLHRRPLPQRPRHGEHYPRARRHRPGPSA
jgi:acetylornithine deacetylase ArgE